MYQILRLLIFFKTALDNAVRLGSIPSDSNTGRMADLLYAYLYGLVSAQNLGLLSLTDSEIADLVDKEEFVQILI